MHQLAEPMSAGSSIGWESVHVQVSSAFPGPGFGCIRPMDGCADVRSSGQFEYVVREGGDIWKPVAPSLAKSKESPVL
ncbi:hypothetical protein CEJ45_08230 [Herbaspirillum aquaticum]|uniref:Uncharacterized protein n=1 Tax=Herbaspirillum aquaticum TaxID=568783 RepID=A0A225SVI8_9BURK|nr:hypothetical protein CEJ45_08230 [Herbaspirillum aquaticum]